MINLDRNTNDREIAAMRDMWIKLVESNFNMPLAVLGGKAEVLYLPDNFLEANVFTPAEVELLQEKIKNAGAVIGERESFRSELGEIMQGVPIDVGRLFTTIYNFLGK